MAPLEHRGPTDGFPTVSVGGTRRPNRPPARKAERKLGTEGGCMHALRGRVLPLRRPRSGGGSRIVSRSSRPSGEVVFQERFLVFALGASWAPN